MNQVEAVRRALLELGNVSHQELADFIAVNYGVTLKPQIIPILKATIKDEEILAEWGRKRQVAQTNPERKEQGQEPEPCPLSGTETRGMENA